MTAFAELMAFQRQTEALAQISGRLAWDQETMMPKGAADQRSEEIAAIEAVLHARRCDPRIGEWLAAVAALDAAQDRAQDTAGRRKVALIDRAYRRNARIPSRLASEIARVTSLAQGIWAEARATEDVALFLPTLRQVVALTREKAAALADGGDAYDALMDEYEPGATAASIGAMFDRMRPRLVALSQAVQGADRQPAGLRGRFSADQQLALARELASAFGYDWQRGRLDLAVHPFSSGSGNDSRITTRIAEDDPFNCLYSTIHEVGHACYELNIDPSYLLTPLGQGVSMGVHESQSRIYENQLGRSSAFTGWLFGRMAERFGDIGVADAEAFYGTVNRVRRGYIRTEADEIQYNLHIMLRFDLERQLIAGSLDVADLEAAWNARFAKDFDLAVDRPANGMLQDVHWACGALGYFPTYTLGNVYAGCLWQKMRADVPELEPRLAVGDAGPATNWLRDNVQHLGGLYLPRDVIARACGFEPGEGPLLDYLETKFRAIYRI